MANNYYGYQYETSPRKLETEYKTKKKSKKNTTPKKSTNRKSNSKTKKSTSTKKKENKKQEIKAQNIKNKKIKISIGLKTILLFLVIFFVLFRESQINEMFSKIQSLKTSITTIQKENDQLEISIQNMLNANHIEQVAKERLGMQKLTPKQTVAIVLPKKDYVEHSIEKVIIEEEKTWFEKIIDTIKEFINIE